MSPQDFTYWLQGFFELSNSDTLTESQVALIREHLELVFNKVTPEHHEKETPELPSSDDCDLTEKVREALKKGKEDFQKTSTRNRPNRRFCNHHNRRIC